MLAHLEKLRGIGVVHGASLSIRSGPAGEGWALNQEAASGQLPETEAGKGLGPPGGAGPHKKPPEA